MQALPINLVLLKIYLTDMFVKVFYSAVNKILNGIANGEYWQSKSLTHMRTKEVLNSVIFFGQKTNLV